MYMYKREGMIVRREVCVCVNRASVCVCVCV